VDGLNGPIQDPEGLLEKRISDLGLAIEGSRLERFVARLKRELTKKGVVRWQPSFYLTDEWGCPSGQPIVGIPFYLADPKLSAIERQFNDLESDVEIMMYLRHEAGHAYNYAYRLYATPEWRELFGPYRRPYRDHYRPRPMSRAYVRHIAGWYAQKHPDEDFAETFAVWLNPRSGWRRRYRTWPALKKLLYVDRVVRAHANVDPLRKRGYPDVTAGEMAFTLGEFYTHQQRTTAAAVQVEMQSDLPDIFLRRPGRKKTRPAADLVLEHRELITDKIEYWTGVQRPVVRALVESMAAHCREANLHAEVGKEARYLVELATYGTTLAMNYLTRGHFEPA
jgi:hypothetical protein